MTFLGEQVPSPRSRFFSRAPFLSGGGRGGVRADSRGDKAAAVNTLSARKPPASLHTRKQHARVVDDVHGR